MNTSQLITTLTHKIASLDYPHPLRVAIDGVDASGKTTLADQLVKPLEVLGRQVLRASIDSFHNPRKVRYARGSDSPEGYYLDSFDYPALRDILLDSLGPQGDRQVRLVKFDYHSDSPVSSSQIHAQSNSILIFDGVFLQRPELESCWDYVIYLHVDFEIAIERAIERDQNQFPSLEAARQRYMKRYLPGQRIYLHRCNPLLNADLVLDNNDSQDAAIIHPKQTNTDR